MAILHTVTLMCLVLAVQGNPTQFQAPFKCQEELAISECKTLIKNNPAILPGFVRLTFHDCVGTGGCNGCVDLSNGDNAGLSPYMSEAEVVYDERIMGTMSRADFWVLCSHVAIREGQAKSALPTTAEDASSLLLEMKYGRIDCNETDPNQSAPSDAYPSPHGTYQMTTGYFSSEFGLSANETIALLGAHTLGRARPTASGFMDKWVDDEFAFDNIYYKDILDKSLDWVQSDREQGDDKVKLQWSQNSTGTLKNLMFTADMCLAFDVQPIDDNGTVNVTFDEIPNSDGNSLVQTYANNNAKWLEDFSVAYTKMVEKTANDVALVKSLPDGNNPVCGSAKEVMETTTSGAGRPGFLFFF